MYGESKNRLCNLEKRPDRNINLKSFTFQFSRVFFGCILYNRYKIINIVYFIFYILFDSKYLFPYKAVEK